MRVASKKLRDSARGEQCTFQIAGVCNYQSETVSLCHLPDESHGMARKSDDFCAAFGCSDCHSVVDGRARNPEYTGNEGFYNNRANRRTIRRWLELGLIKIEGFKCNT
jgi:hypothetical protein